MSAAAKVFQTPTVEDWFRADGSTYRMVPDAIRELPKELWHAATEAFACIQRFLGRKELDQRATDKAMAEESGWSESFLQKGFHALDAGMKALDLKPIIVRERIHGRRQFHPGIGLKGKPPKDARDEPAIADPPPAPPPGDRTDTTTDGPSSSSPRPIDPEDPLIKRGLALIPDATADRIAAAIAGYSAEWVARALDQVEKRNRKPGNRPVRAWIFVLRILEHWKAEGGPPAEPKPPAPTTPRPTPTAAEEPPRRMTAEEVAALVKQCTEGDRTLRKFGRLQIRQAIADGLVPTELVPTIPADLLAPHPRE